MAARKSFKEYNATDLLRQWKSIVNQHVMAGRDAKMLKDALELSTPSQILLGMFQYKEKNITIPQFLKQVDDWREDDEVWAEIELATWVSGYTPIDYYVFLDYVEDETSNAFVMSNKARQSLREWADKVLS